MKRSFFVALVICFAFSFVLQADVITLKDDQQFNADVISCDNYYITVALANGNTVALPWTEIRRMEHTNTPCNSAEELHINNQDAEVNTLIAPFSKDLAWQRAIFPGVIIHGAGHAYAKDQNTSLSLVSVEVLSVILMGISVNDFLTPTKTDSENYSVTQIMGTVGAVAFLGSWLYDIIFAPAAVEKFNSDKKFMINDKSEANTSTEDVANTLNSKAGDK